MRPRAHTNSIVEYGKIFGHFDAKAKVLRVEDAGEPTLELAGSQRIKLEITGSRTTDRIDFAIVGDESIKICRKSFELSRRAHMMRRR